MSHAAWPTRYFIDFKFRGEPSNIEQLWRSVNEGATNDTLQYYTQLVSIFELDPSQKTRGESSRKECLIISSTIKYFYNEYRKLIKDGLAILTRHFEGKMQHTSLGNMINAPCSFIRHLLHDSSYCAEMVGDLARLIEEISDKIMPSLNVDNVLTHHQDVGEYCVSSHNCSSREL